MAGELAPSKEEGKEEGQEDGKEDGKEDADAAEGGQDVVGSMSQRTPKSSKERSVASPGRQDLTRPSTAASVMETPRTGGRSHKVLKHKDRSATKTRLSTGSQGFPADGDERLRRHRQDREKDDAARDATLGGMKSNRFCAALSDKELGEVWEAMEFFVFEAGECIVKQGDHGQYFFVCHNGHLEVNASGTVVNTLGAGDAFGANALLYSCPRTATVTAKAKSTVWGADGDTFRKVMQDNARARFAENRKFLDSVQLFDGLSSHQKERIGELAIYNESFDAGCRVVTEGEDAAAIYFIKKGSLTEWKGRVVDSFGNHSGGTQVSTLSTGDAFGEKDVLHAEPRTSTVITESVCELVVIGVPQLKEVLGEDFIACLEQCFVLSVLKQVQVLVHLSLSQRVKIVQAMEVKNYRAGQGIGEGLRLGIVMDGEFAGTQGGEPITLRRGQWWEDEALAGLQQRDAEPSSPKASSSKADYSGHSFKLSKAVAGPSGARLATLGKEDLAEALRELGLSTVSLNSEEVIDYMRKILLAKKVPIFRDLSEEQVDGLVSSLVLKRYTRGAQVFKQGETGNTFFIIAKGEVRIVKDGNALRTLAKGTCFGERALLFHELRSATVEVASVEAELWSVERKVFTEVISESMRAELIHRIELQDTSVELKELKHVRLIGAGAFGSVRLVEHTRKKTRYALKRVRKQRCSADGSESDELTIPPEVQQECDLLASMDHPFILRMVRTFETDSSIYILTELITGGQLYEQTHDRMGILSRKQAQFYIGSLVAILEHVHGASVVYRDLKPENVMLDASGYLKLVDFGLAKRLDDAQSRTYTAVGTLLYMAPEVIRGHGYGFEVDIWSLGVMFYELVCGHLPFNDSVEDEHEILASILESELEFPSRYADQAGKKLIQAMLTKQPENRIGSGMSGWEEIKEHKFFKAGVSGNIFSKILGRDMEAPVVPGGEQYSNERDLNEKVTMSDDEELAEDVTEVVRERIMSTFKQFDINGDGTIDTGELRKLLQLLDPVSFAGEGADKLLAAVDKDQSGLVKFDDFLTWVAGDQSSEATDFRKAVDLDIHV